MSRSFSSLRSCSAGTSSADAVDLAHLGQFLELGLQPPGFFRRVVRVADGMPARTGVALDQLFLPAHRLEIAGLHVQQVVIVADVLADVGQHQSETDADRNDPFGPVRQTGKPLPIRFLGLSKRQDRRLIKPEALAADFLCNRLSNKVNKAGMTMKHDRAHKRTPQPAIQPSSATALRSASMVAKKARAVVRAAVRMPGPRRPRCRRSPRAGWLRLAFPARNASPTGRRNRPCR